ncbi:hypothetical protein D9C01_13905, partial [Corynebacterium diphtheriae]
ALQGRVNYIRNSVKATVDAYDGSVTLYAWDDQDSLSQGPNAALQGRVNYIRNSVKATVDAYDGSVTLYAWDDQD